MLRDSYSIYRQTNNVAVDRLAAWGHIHHIQHEVFFGSRLPVLKGPYILIGSKYGISDTRFYLLRLLYRIIRIEILLSSVVSLGHSFLCVRPTRFLMSPISNKKKSFGQKKKNHNHSYSSCILNIIIIII